MRERIKGIEDLDLAEDEGAIAGLARSMIKCSAKTPTAKACSARRSASTRVALSDQRLSQDAEKILNHAVFSVCYDEMVVLKDIEMFSLCEHHMLPFFGRCHVAYIPGQESCGAVEDSAPGGYVCAPAADPGTPDQSDCAGDSELINPLGVGVVIEARHLCMVMRGVEKQRSETITSAMLGEFRENKQTRDEFLSLIGASQIANRTGASARRTRFAPAYK